MAEADAASQRLLVRVAVLESGLTKLDDRLGALAAVEAGHRLHDDRIARIEDTLRGMVDTAAVIKTEQARQREEAASGLNAVQHRLTALEARLAGYGAVGLLLYSAAKAAGWLPA